MTVAVYTDDGLARYAFGDPHPFSPPRLDAFVSAVRQAALLERVDRPPARSASRLELELFHTAAYVDAVVERSRDGSGFLDGGDTPAFVGVYEAAALVVGTALDAMERLLDGRARRAFVPIAGLHHARPAIAGGFCVFNDCAVVIRALRSRGLSRVAYVDIDAHHGDGVYYPFVADPSLVFADIHEDGGTLYPGTGRASERGTGDARGCKLNVPLLPGAGDAEFHAAWPRVEALLEEYPPEFVIVQCGADGLSGDPITHLQYTTAVHRLVAERLCALTDRHCPGRLLALGGGGYRLENLAAAWTEVVAAFVANP